VISVSGQRVSSDAPVTAAASLHDVGFTYPNGTVALDGFSLALPAGQVTGIVGPSGGGKSTMLQLLAGLTAPTSGSIEFNVDRTPGRHDLSMVFQQDTLLPWLTVEENVSFYFKLHGGNRKAVAADVEKLIEMVGLTQFRKAYPKQLSGGMRRRVAFLAAVAPKPQLLLLDEPFSSVDEPTRVGIHQQVLGIFAELHTTAVLVTHDLAEAICLSNQVVILSARPGRVVSTYEIPFGEDRDVLELRNQPDFLKLYGELWHDLSEQIVRSQRQGDDV
jgi:NitT/TauT family transport system ATP-binding protein